MRDHIEFAGWIASACFAIPVRPAANYPQPLLVGENVAGRPANTSAEVTEFLTIGAQRKLFVHRAGLHNEADLLQ